jgi:membrane dipeptidase
MNENRRSRLSRREFVSMLAASGAAFLLPRTLNAQEVDPRATRIVNSNLAVDMHNHASIRLLAKGKTALADVPMLDVAAEMKKGGFASVCYTYAVDGIGAHATADEYYNAHINALNQMDVILERQNMRRAYNLKDIEAAHKNGQPVIIQDVEGTEFIGGHLQRVEESYRRGVRLFQLVHFYNDPVKPLGDIQGNVPPVGGLTQFGAEVIRECNRLHLPVDLAHGEFAMVKGAAKVAKQPFIVSHTALDTPFARQAVAGFKEPVSPVKRFVSPEYAKTVADAGGIVGIWHLFPTLKDYIHNIKQLVDVVGVDHVGIGTDTALAVPQSSKRKDTNDYFPDEKGGFFYAVASEMLKQGFSPEEIGKIIGGNFCRVFGEITGNRS